MTKRDLYLNISRPWAAYFDEFSRVDKSELLKALRRAFKNTKFKPPLEKEHG